MNISTYLHKIFRKYKLELFLLILSTIVISIASVVLYLSFVHENETVITIEDITQPEKKPIRNVITVDVSGSVLKPSIYTVPIGTRIHDVLKLAGGLDTQADAAYIARNFNFSLVLLDHHKLHFPSLKEIHQGTFVEQPRSLTYLEVENKGNNKSTPPVSNSSLISINTAEKSQLDSLPGIGEKTAQKIIENRPYDNLTILTEKKIVTAKVFEGLKDLIQL